MESSCYLLLGENSKETALFSGDTLFIGDVGLRLSKSSRRFNKKY
jgi:glyoxylase-like metal-dependent hydrolase (beta-lactamase superfamily II)